MSPVPDLLWDAQTFKGIDCSKNEQKTARYLGYCDVGELRKYQASHLFLRISLLWFSAVIPKSFRMSAIFKILDSTKKEDMAKQFGGTIPELRQRYPFTTTHSPSDAVDAENRKRFLTSLLFLLIHDDSVFDPQKQLTLEEEFKNRPDNRTLPKLVGGPIAPKWGPHANEDWGEPYNRAWMCIAQFNTSWSRWHERHGKEGGLAKTIIPDTHLPTFMAASNAAQSTPRSTPTVKVKQAIPMLEPKTFSLYWADDIARKEELEAMHHVIPVSSLRGPDPRAVPAAEWRDKVRVLYDFEKLKLNFSSLKLHYTEDEQDEALDLLNEDWSVVQAVCTRVDQANLQKIRFRTRPQEIGEILREGSGVPSVLKNYVMCEDNGRLQKTDAALGQEEDNHLLAAPLDESKGDPNPEGDPPLGKPHQKAAKKRAEKEAVEAKEDVFVEKTLEQLTDRVGRKRDPTSGPGMPDPVKAYAHADTDDVLREHGGVDIRLPELRREWTMKMLVKHGAGVSIKTAQPVDPVVMELSGATSALEESVASGSQKGQTERERQTAFYRLNAALASGPKQAGPDVHLCAIILGIDETSPDEAGRLKCSMLEKEIWLYPWQINGIVDLFLKLIGHVPMSSPRLKEHASKPDVIHALEQVLGLPVSQDGQFESVQDMYDKCARGTAKDTTKILVPGGAFLADQTGMGKTIMVLFLIACMVENVEVLEGNSKPTLVVCPAMLVESWANVCLDKFPNLSIAIMYAEAQKFANSKLASRAIPTSFTKNLPDLKGAPQWLRPAFESKTKHNKWVIFASIDTFIARSVVIKPDLDKPRVPRSFHTSSGEQKTTLVYPTKFVSKMREMFGLVVMDEGHKYRNALTHAFFSIKGLRASLILIVTATPMISSAFDMVGLLGLIYKPSYKKQLDEEQLASIKSLDDEEFYEFVSDLAPEDPRRLMAIEPRRIKRLLEQGTSQVSRLFHIAEDLVMLKRNSSSSIPYSTQPGGNLCLESFYPRWSVNTINVEHRADEAEEFQILTLLAARSFYAFIENFKPGGSEDQHAPPPDVAGPRAKKHTAFPVAPLRELAIITCSTKLARLHYQLKNAGLNTKVAFMNVMRERGMGADFLAVMTYEKGDHLYRTRDDLLAFLTHGSPKLRVLFTAIHETCFVDGTKLLVVEDVPFCAKFYEDCCRAAWIHCEVLHSKLNQTQRQKLLEDFNDPESSLKVLIIMIEVASTGLNLQKASHRVLSLIPAKRSGPQMQAENRVLRVDQAKPVEISRVIVKNSHDIYREARQTSNVRLEIATKAHLPAMRLELVNVLNENQQWLRDFRTTDYAHRLLGEESKPESNGNKSDNDSTNPGQAQEHSSEGKSDAERDFLPSSEKESLLAKSLQDATARQADGSCPSSTPKEGDEWDFSSDDLDSDSSYGTDHSSFSSTDDDSLETDEYELDTDESISGDESDSDSEDMASNIDEDEFPNLVNMSREDRENFNQDEFFARQLLKLDADRTYTDKDLANEKILNRAIDLLHHKRQGQSQVTRVIGVHVNYGSLPPNIKAAALDEKELCLRREGATRLAQKKKALTRLRVVWSKGKSDRAEDVESEAGRGTNETGNHKSKSMTKGDAKAKAKEKAKGKGKGKDNGKASGKVKVARKRPAAAAAEPTKGSKKRRL